MEEIYLFEVGEPKELKLVKKIYKIFYKSGNYCGRNVIVKITGLKNNMEVDFDCLGNSNINNYIVRFISKEFKTARIKCNNLKDTLIINVEII